MATDRTEFLFFWGPGSPDTCACKLHGGPYPADTRCAMCDQPFCHACLASCRHKCDWGGGVTEQHTHELERATA